MPRSPFYHFVSEGKDPNAYLGWLDWLENDAPWGIENHRLL